MAQHMVTAELLETWFDVKNVREQLEIVWLDMAREAQEHDLSRMYIQQALEWASREQESRFYNGTIKGERCVVLR